MPNRTVKVHGWGSGTASLKAELDGQVVFDGDVELTEFTEETSDQSRAPTLFSFEIPIDFEGIKQMKIQVGGMPVRFGTIVANYCQVDWGPVFYTGPDGFDDVSPVGELGIRDPRRNIRIDGIEQEFQREGRMGTWHWTINPGSVLEHDLLVKAGSEFES